MRSQLQPGVRPQGNHLNWLPQRASVQRRVLKVHATSGAAPPPAKELSKDLVTRQYRRTVYDFALWQKHRDVNRYLYNLKTIPGSRIIRTLSQPMGVVLAWAALFGFYETCLEAGVLPSYLPTLTLTSAEPQGLTSFALSLLLVFRTNSSYGRFDEARKIWGGILNRARNIANQAVTFIPAEDRAGREAVGKWTVGFCRALQAHLQEDADLRAELQKAQPRWSPEEIDILCSAQHRPIKAISMLSELTRQLSISEFQALQMQENVTFFYDALGGCERLLRTPIPVSYTRHTARFLTIWLSLLPLGLWERYHWSMLPVIALIGFLLLGIDEIGISIEEPFGILPLDAICTRAQTDVVSLIKDDPQVSKYIADVREGRILPPPEPAAASAAAAAAPAAAAASATPVVVPTVANPGNGGNRSSGSAPQAQQPDMLKTVTSLFSNVRNGVGAVAPAPPRPPSPKPSPRSRSPPSRSASPFPRASAGTGMMPPTPPPVKPSSAPANGSSKSAAPSVSGSGFTMSFSGLAGGAAAAASKLSKMADSVTSSSSSQVVEVSASPAAPASPKATSKPEAPAAAKREASAAVQSVVVTPAPSASSDDGSSRSGSGRRVALNWRDELEAMRNNPNIEDLSGSSMDEPPAMSYTSGAVGVGSSADEADDEALRRFGGLAGRSRPGGPVGSVSAYSNGSGNGYEDLNYSNGNGNGNGFGSSSGRSSRPRTRPDWRNQL